MIAVTGATGGMGGRIARRLAEREAPQRLLVRDAARAPALPGAAAATIGGYDDVAGLRDALAGADTLMLIPAHEDRDRVALHRTVVEAAADAGVERIVLLSFVGAASTVFTFGRDHARTEELVRDAGVRWSFPRMNLYADFLPALAGADGVIRGPAGGGAVAAVARDDLADVCAAMLLDPERFDGAAVDVTGPAAFTLDELAAELTALSGREVRYERESVEEAWASRAGMGEDWEVEGWITSYASIGRGELAALSDAVERIAGHPPQSLGDVLRAQPESWAHLRA